MSLDVYLKSDTPVKITGSGIYIRENGKNKQISASEWNERYPDRQIEEDMQKEYETIYVYENNITHNLWEMAEAAGIYKHLWKPEELHIYTASELIEPLKAGLKELKSNPKKYKKYNPANGWGNYENLVEFVEDYLNACKKYPSATITVSR
jgi:hypothetical protein